MKKIIRYFIQGLLTAAPIFITIYILAVLFNKVGSVLNALGIKINPYVDPVIGFFGVLILVVLLAFRYVSVGSMTAAVSFPLFLAFVPAFKQGNPTLLIFSSIIAILIIWTHRTNIQKLRNGTENKANLFSKK